MLIALVLPAWSADFVVPRDGSLAEGLTAAAGQGSFEIVLDPGVYLYATGGTAHSGLDVTIRALVPNTVTLEADGSDMLRMSGSSLVLEGVDLDCQGARCVDAAGGSVELRGVRSLARSGSGNGGVIRGTGGATVTLTRSTLLASDQSGSGGHIDVDGALVVTGSHLELGGAGSDGGAVRATGGLTMTRSLVTDGTANNGGALAFSSGATIADSTFLRNAATNAGGAIRGVGTARIDRSVLCESNGGSGGAVWWQNAANTTNTFDVNHTMFLHSESATVGGGARIPDTSGTKTIRFIRPSFIDTLSNDGILIDSDTSSGDSILVQDALILHTAQHSGTAAFFWRDGQGSGTIDGADYWDWYNLYYPVGFSRSDYQEDAPGFAIPSGCDPLDAIPDGSTANRGAVHSGGIHDADSDLRVAGLDCDEGRADTWRGAPDTTCDGVDQDCDGRVDDDASDTVFYRDFDEDGAGDPGVSVAGCASSPPDYYVANADDCDDTDPLNQTGRTWYRDADGDGYGDPGENVDQCGQPNGYVDNADDCDDTVFDTSPGGTWYDDLDADGYGDPATAVVDCVQPVGTVDNGDDCDDTTGAVTTGDLYYADLDGDGYGTGPGAPACAPPANTADNDLDCDDGDPTVQGMVAFARDLDGDGYGDPDASDLLCAADATHVVDTSDCDDSDPDVNPAGLEVCNGADDDCDGLVDEDGSPTTWYRDADADGFGDASLTQIACAAPAGFVVDGTDCDDTAPDVNPGAAEICDGADQDCDGLADQGLPTFTFYADGDGDGYGTGTASMDCVQPVGTALVANDCDDADPDVSPGATETCNGVDDDCDGETDEGTSAETWYRDADGDGYGDALDSVLSCEPLVGFAPQAGDCDDVDFDVNPAAEEVCNGVDDDCDGETDEGGSPETWYRDNDGDGYGDPLDSQLSCSPPPGFVTQAGDCLDFSPTVHPGATEICNGVDDDCDLEVDEGLPTQLQYPDSDGDGHGEQGSQAVAACGNAPGFAVLADDCDDTDPAVHPGVSEVCNGVDDDCDGDLDEGLSPVSYYLDGDGDGFGSGEALVDCMLPEGGARAAGDCDDTDPDVSPAAEEVCGDGTDNDCDPSTEDDCGPGVVVPPPETSGCGCASGPSGTASLGLFAGLLALVVRRRG